MKVIKVILGLEQKPNCVVLYYHSIFDTEKTNFEKQLRLLSTKTNVIHSNQFDLLRNNENYSMITFDDGFENLLENAIPILEKYKLPYTIFFVTSYFGKIPGWDIPNSDPDKNEKIMTTQQMLKISNALLTIGSHSVTHRKLVELSHDEMKEELIKSKRTLEDIMNSEVNLFAFPNGEYNEEITKAAFDAGYERTFTIEPKLACRNSDEKVIGRFSVDGNDWMIEFYLKMKGAYSWKSLLG